MKLSELPNIGVELEKKLEIAGIHTPDELIKTGSFEPLQLIGITQEPGCISTLYALEGAIQGIRWHHLPADVKNGLREKLREDQRKR